MPKPKEITLMELTNLFTYEDPAGKRYFNGASTVMRDSKRLELDPIHFIRFALTDPFAQYDVQRFIEQHDLTVEEVEEAMGHLRHEGFSTTRGANGDMAEGTTAAMRAMYEALRTGYIERDKTAGWNWYHQAFLAAMASETSLAVTRLLAVREARV